jgi:TrmH family RNA methyltransferase
MIKTITSPTNPLIQRAIKLHSSKYRTHYKEFIAEGIRIIATLVQANHIPAILFVTENVVAHAQKIISDEKIVIISESLMKKISTAETPSGMVALFAIPAQPDVAQLSAGIVLVDMQNPGNAGTLVRTAVAMNKKTAVFVGGVDPWNPKVVQASAGAIGLINIFQLTWEELVTHKKIIPLCALVVANGKQPDTKILHNAFIVVGNEGQGLSKKQVEQCDETITLTMPGSFESLNAAVAGSIALYISSQHE